MQASAAHWDEVEHELLGSVSADYRFDPEIVPLVVALNLYGFPTIGSCIGHPWDGVDEEGPWIPYVAMRWRMPKRFACTWLQGTWVPTDANVRERRAMALLAWKVYRPAVWTLRSLLNEFYEEHPQERLVQVTSSWDHVALRPPSLLWDLDLEEGNQLVAAAGKQFALLGEWMRRQLLDS